MNRLANPKDGGQYAFYYSVIKGWQDVADGKATTVSGITTPDDKTIVFHLTKPTGDFNLRMSMPATAPIPKEVGDCFEGKPGDYGRNVISSGPYMIKGSDGTFSSCSALKPFSGYDGANGNHIMLVRNPNYDQSTDQYRKNYPDQFQYLVNSNADDIYAQVAGRAARRRAVEPAAEDDPAVRDGSDPEAAPALERRRPHLVHDDEPDAAAVRRHPRAQGDEPDHGQERPPQGLGRPVVGSIATHIAPPVHVQQRARRVRPVRDPRTRRATSTRPLQR